MTAVDETTYLPSESSPLPVGPWLILAPHPDDETFGMGGTLLLAQAAGINVDVIFLTDGSAGGSSESEIVVIRENEAREAATKLGIRDILFWREQDRSLAPSQCLIKRLSNEIKQRQPAHLFFPMPQEPHPDHRAAAVLAWESLRHCNFISIPISYEISVQGHCNHLIDISNIITKKQALMACYSSQITENHYIERILGLNQARAWSLPLSVSHAEAFYVWPKQDRPINAMLLSIATQQSSAQALPDTLPLISVITRTQNRPQTLREAIRSVAGQTHTNIELIVVNDGGENCRELVEEEATGHIRQHHYEHLDISQGRSHAANVGLSIAQGQFIIFLDDDDWFESHHLAILASELEQDKEAIAAYSSIQCIDESDNKIKVFDKAFDPIQLCIENYIPIHAILFRRKAITQNCLFDEKLNWCEDWDFWLQVSRHGEFRFVSEIGATYRMQRVGSGIWNDPHKTQQAMLLIYKKWLPKWDEKTLWRIFEYARHKHYLDQKSKEYNEIMIEKEREYNKLIHEKGQEYHQIVNAKDNEYHKIISEKDLEFNEAVTQKNQEIMQQNEALRLQNESQQQQSEKLFGNQQHINALLAEVDSLRHKAGALEQEIAAVYASTSWKISLPIRLLRTVLRHLKKILKRVIYFCWIRMPISIQQRMVIKKHVRKNVPYIEHFSPFYTDHITPQIDEANHGTADKKYLKEYQDRFKTTIDNFGSDYVPLTNESVDTLRAQAKVIAFYLPQFHPIDENDREWGKGFTEWTNVSKAVSQFADHYQPRLPGELGFYDLRLKAIQQRQIELAKQYGIHGFCYYHYWFGGKKVLEKPFQQMLDDPTLNFPFCLCWANENWTRRWDGGEDEIILSQQHSPEDDINFIQDIIPALKDKRYIRINGKPLLIVYRPSLLPDPAATAKRWRRIAIEAGVGNLHIVSAATFGFENFADISYDGLVQFPPHNIQAPDITHTMNLLNPYYKGHVYDYVELSNQAIINLNDKRHTFPCVMMNWDNEARRPGLGHSFQGGTPKNYKTWLKKAFDFVINNNLESERVVFVNAWNEWAEGTYLEPDRRYGYSYLNVTANVIRNYYKDEGIKTTITENNRHFNKSSNTVIALHLYYYDLVDEILDYLQHANNIDLLVTLPTHTPRSVIDKIISALDNVYLHIVPNKGRDILPFLTAFDIIEAFGYEYLLKIHTKKSISRKDGELLRKNAFDSLLGNTTVDKIVRCFEKDCTIGLIGPSDAIISLSQYDYLVNNKKNIQFCLTQLGYETTSLNFDFIAGSMFWARVDALKALPQLALNEDNFEEEIGQLDGTMAHAVERIFSYIAVQKGYKSITIDQL